MDAFGVEISPDSLEVSQVRQTAFGLSYVDCFTLPPGEDGLARLKERLAGARAPRIGLSVRGASVSRVFEIPAPDRESLAGALKFEMERHLPFDGEPSSAGFTVLKRHGSMHSALFCASVPAAVEDAVAPFKAKGLKPDAVIPPESALLNSLARLGLINDGKTAAFIRIGAGHATIDTFSGSVPLYSRSSRADKAGSARRMAGECALAFAAHEARGGRAFDRAVLFTVEPPSNELVASVKDGMRLDTIEVWTARELGFSPVALGAALAALGKGRFTVDLLSEKGSQRGRERTFSYTAASLALALLVLTGGSLLARDRYRISHLRSEISGLKERNAALQRSMKALDTAAGRAALLERIGGRIDAGPLSMLERVAASLPKKTVLTSFETSTEAVFIEGITESASALILLLSSSGFGGAELTGQAVKTRDGERFRIRLDNRGFGGAL